MRCTTQQCILQQVQMYPALQPLDLLKFLHQSTFGCGHLIGAPEAAEAYLVREAATCHPSDSPALEPLDGNYCRVNLRYLQELCISFKTFSRLFAISAAQPSGTVTDLEARLQIAMQLAGRASPLLRCRLIRRNRTVARTRLSGHPPFCRIP